MRKLYPIKFTPIFKKKIWGGSKLKTVLNKPLKEDKIGESWEISGVENYISVVENGVLAGKSLEDIISEYGDDLLGPKVMAAFEGQFPLLFKFIDAEQNLSLQLHPNDKIAKKRHDSFGKTEMWYIMQSEEESGVYLGLKEGATKEDYKKHLEQGSLDKIMNFIEVKKGDTFFIKPGLIHGIGKGVLLAEIQQSSDITYRVYDWNRKNQEGKYRELHTEWAETAIDFDASDFRINYSQTTNSIQTLTKNKYFCVRKINFEKNQTINYGKTDSFVVIMCVEGEAELFSDSHKVKIGKGETILLPYTTEEAVFKGAKVELLETTL